MKKKNIGSRFLPVKIEYLFVILGLLFGTIFNFTNPPWHTNDEDRHFYAAYSISDGQFVPENKNNMSGTPLPRNLVGIVQSYQGIPYYQGSKLDKARMAPTLTMSLNEKDTVFVANPSLLSNPIPYIPHAIGIKLGKIIDSNPVALNHAGRIGGLLMFLIILFFAIRITPIFKSAFFLYGLTPMVLYQASSVTYDTLNIAFTFLILALCLKFAFQTEKLSRNDWILIVSMLVLHRYSKDGYPLIPLLLLIVPAKKLGFEGIKSYAYYAGFAVFFIVLYFLPNWTWLKYVNSLELLPVAGGIKDFIYGSPTYLTKILSDPFEATGNMISSTLFQRQDWMGGVIGRFGYSYSLMPKFFMIIHGIVLMSVAFFDSKSDIVFQWWQRLIIAITGLGTVALIIAGWYMASPLGSSTIWGLQGRYFVPAVPIILLMFYNNKFENKFWTNWKGLIVSAYIIIALIYTIIFMNDAFYS
ncbi:MAG: DUF2142 domain-containing protein [Bacteroidota bacterium]